MIRRGMVPTALAAVMTLAACSSASMILKTPIANECATTGLRGCPELAEGMLLYVEGNKAAAIQKLAQGAAQNAPDKVEAFTQALLALKDVPGAEPYVAMLEEAAVVLREHAGADLPHELADAGANSKHTSAGASPETVHGALSGKTAEVCASRSGGQQILTADTDPARALGGIVAPHRLETAAEATQVCKKLAGGEAACQLLPLGTAYVTDLISLGSDCAGQFVAVLGKDQVVRYSLEGPFRLHGARLLLQPGDVLVLGQREGPLLTTEPVDDASVVVLEEVDPHYQCNLLWSGFRPYPNRVAKGP